MAECEKRAMDSYPSGWEIWGAFSVFLRVSCPASMVVRGRGMRGLPGEWASLWDMWILTLTPNLMSNLGFWNTEVALIILTKLYTVVANALSGVHLLFVFAVLEMNWYKIIPSRRDQLCVTKGCTWLGLWNPSRPSGTCQALGLSLMLTELQFYPRNLFPIMVCSFYEIAYL